MMTSTQVHGLWVPESDAKVFGRYASFEGLPDLDVSKVAKCVALCTSFATAIDIGAHVGAVTVYLARKFDRVVALEAVPSTFEYLERNTASLDNVTALNIAAGPESGETYITHYLSHGQLDHVSVGTEVPKTSRVGPIPVSTIDGLELDSVSFVKIDVEGYERPVLEGAVKTLERCRPLVLVEQGGNEEKHFGRPRDEASAFLESLGMRQHPEAPHMKNDRLFTF
jgi:FkbM family methyltransferase